MGTESGKYDRLRVRSKISIAMDGQDHDGMMGKGVVQLLEGIEELGSLNKAAIRMGMAYSKAWRIVGEVESGFGFDLIVRDGARGSTLTEEGRALLRVYRQVQEETAEFANRRFREELEKLRQDPQDRSDPQIQGKTQAENDPREQDDRPEQTDVQDQDGPQAGNGSQSQDD